MRSHLRIVLFGVLLAAGVSAAAAQQASDTVFEYKPYPIVVLNGKVIVAGDVHALVYHGLTGKDIAAQPAADPHGSPERLVYRLFESMKKKDLAAIAELYGATVKKNRFNRNRIAKALAPFDDIRFRSKFRSGDLTVVRYDFVAADTSFPYFAMVRKDDRGYSLTMDVDVSEPLNFIGSFSPSNLFDRPAAGVDTKGMTPFYFARSDQKVLYAPAEPPDEYTALYIAFTLLNKAFNSPEQHFMDVLHKASGEDDTLAMRDVLAPDQLPLLSDPFYRRYLYAEIRKVFRYHRFVNPMAAVPTSDGEVVFIGYADSGQTTNYASLIFKKGPDGFRLALKVDDNDLGAILQNVYVREAILEFVRRLD